MNNITVGISTFKHRFESIKSLVNQVRGIHSTVPIIIAVNGEFDEPFDEQYRSNLLKFVADVPFCYPIFHTEFRSLAKLWNEIIIHASTEYIYILNDDVEVTNRDVFKIIEKEIKENNTQLFLAPSNSWSHFVISKYIANLVGYFDERLLGVGEEDGDFEWRYHAITGERVKHLPFTGVRNLSQWEHKSKVKAWVHNKTSFNHEFIYNEKYKQNENGDACMFDYKVINVMGDAKQYPYEVFFKINKSKLG